MKFKYLVFSPYFGSLPNNFDLWLSSCSYNKNFKFIVFTDDKRKHNIPKNVEIINISFDEFKNKIQSKFDFKINLDNPYKICDIRPAFGYIFNEYINDNYKYYGYCDLDLIFGDLEKYLPKEEYDRIGFEGHFSLFKNTKDIKEAFMLDTDGKLNYKDVYSSNIHFGADEIGKYGIKYILDKYNYKTFNYKEYVADINCKYEGLNITYIDNNKIKTDFGNRIFEFNNGKIYSYTLKDNNIDKKEYAYIHFQKRKMNVDVKNVNNFLIFHHSMEDIKKIDKDLIINNQPKRKRDLLKNIKLIKRAIIIRIKRKLVK